MRGGWLMGMAGMLLTGQAHALVTNLPVETLQLTPPAAVKGVPLAVKVEVASDEASREQGLMFRRTLAADAGMLFTWPQAGVEKFWMRNTYLPLDMLFFNHGQLVNVVAWARPMDESAMGPDGPVDAVLEVNGGWAASHHVEAGWSYRVEK